MTGARRRSTRSDGFQLCRRRLAVEFLEPRRLLAAGDLDPTFGAGGVVTTEFYSNPLSFEYAFATAIQADGKILAAGTGGALVRYLPNGSFDSTFGVAGQVRTVHETNAIAVQSDGKIVIAGTSNSSFALSRYNANGTLDTTFDGDGKLTTSFGTSPSEAFSVAIQSDGKIVAAGSGRTGSSNDFALVRYNSNGTLDTSFGSGGKVTTDIGGSHDSISAMVIQSNGKIVVAGYSFSGSYDDFALARYNANGSLDTSFDGDGKLTTAIGNFSDRAYGVALQSDGKIVAAGGSLINSNTDFALVRYNANGSLDTSFDGDGKVTTAFSTTTDTAHGVAIQSDGKIVAAGSGYNGSSNDFALARYNPNGSLDTGFSGDGKLLTDFGTAIDGANAMALQSDGKIVAVGIAQNPSYDIALARYNVNGSLDASFGSGGKVSTSLGASDEYAQSVAIQSDGKLVTAGVSTGDFALARYNANGTLDTAFGGDGKVTTAIGTSGEQANSMAIQSDGKIVAAGYSFNGGSADFALVRYNGNGTLDSGFDGDGKLTTAIGAANDYAYSLAIQSDGKIVAAGSSHNGSNDDFALVRYNPNGSLDTGFGSGGKVTTAVGVSIDRANSVAIQSDGKIVVAGYSYIGSKSEFALVRYNPNGSLDTAFGSGGKVTTAFGTLSDLAHSIAIQSDGKLVVGGYSYNGSNYDFALARYNSNGSLDTTFAGDGKLTTALGSSHDVAYKVAIQSNGKILAAGSSENGGSYDFALARYNANGALDVGFGSGGKVITSHSTGYDRAYSMALQSDGKIVVAGVSNNGNDDDFTLVRYVGDPVATIAGRKLFYNNSNFDGSNPAANSNDDGAIAANKSPLLPGSTATGANYSSYARGINGVMVDIQNAAASGNISAADFGFRTGNDLNLNNWSTGPGPSQVAVRGMGGGITRVTLIWPDGAIVGQWLEVTVKATPNTGLGINDMFYFGNAPGDTGDANPAVNGTDFANVRANPKTFLNPAAINDPRDFNRDGRVNAADLAVVRDHSTTAATALKMISPPMSLVLSAPLLGADDRQWIAAEPAFRQPAEDDDLFQSLDYETNEPLAPTEGDSAAIDRLMASLCEIRLSEDRPLRDRKPFDAEEPSDDLL